MQTMERRTVAPVHPRSRRPAPWPVEFYRSAVGKKWVMALTGIALMGYVFVHMFGNLKVYFGAEDYIASIGGRRTAEGREVLYARSEVVLAGAVAGVGVLDQAVVAARDEEAYRADARVGRDLGYDGKICIHPSQVALAHEAFTPTDDEVAHARAVIEAGSSGVGVLDGEMVDDVHLRMAQAVLSRAGLE